MSEVYYVPIAFIGILLLISFLYTRLTVKHQKITIRDKGIVVNSATAGDTTLVQSDYMIYTTRGEALKNTNCIWFWKFKSDELQGKLRRGHTYYVKTYGVRIPFLGMYKHIITAREITKKPRKQRNNT